MALFGSAKAYTPTLNALAQMPLIARNGGPGSVRDPLPNALGQVARAYHPTPADRARNALASVLQATGQMPGEARATAGNVVGFSPLGSADDFNSGLLQTGRGVSQGSKGDTLGGILAMALAAAPGKKPFNTKQAADVIARQLEAAGFKIERGASNLSSSHYVTASLADADGNELLAPYKIRVSDHDLPPSYGGADYDVGPHDIGNSDWTRVVHHLTEKAGLPVPPATRAVITRNERAQAEAAQAAAQASASMAPFRAAEAARQQWMYDQMAQRGTAGLTGKARKREREKLIKAYSDAGLWPF